QASPASKTTSSPTGAARLPPWSTTRRVARTLVLPSAMSRIPATSSSRELWATRTSVWWALAVGIQATITFTAASPASTLPLAGTPQRSASSQGTTCTESGRTSTTTCCHCWTLAAPTSGPRRTDDAEQTESRRRRCRQQQAQRHTDTLTQSVTASAGDFDDED
ncbi:unnamed protein product, partial [Symbiodinium necroappetens]